MLTSDLKKFLFMYCQKSESANCKRWIHNLQKWIKNFENCPNQSDLNFDDMSIFRLKEQLPWFSKLKIINWELDVGTYQAKARGMSNTQLSVSTWDYPFEKTG